MLDKIKVVISQAASSLSNFALGAFVLWALPITDFADYALVMALALFLAAIQNALINTPLMIEKGKGKDTLVYRFVRYGLVYSVVAIVPIYYFLSLFSVQHALYLSMCLFPLLVLRELSKMVLLWYSDITQMTVLELVQLVVVVAVLLGVYLFDEPSLAWVYSAAGLGLAAFFIGLLCMRPIFKPYRGEFKYRSVVREVKWSLKGVMITEVNSRGYVYLVSAMFGKEFLALVNAPRLIINPVNAMAYAFIKFIRPKLANLLNSGEQTQAVALAREYYWLTLGVAAFAALSCALLWEPLIYDLLFSKFDHTQVSAIAAFWFAVLFVQTAGMYHSNFLQIKRQFKGIFMVSLVSSMVVFLGFALIHFANWSQYSVLAVVAVTEVLVLIGLYKLKREVMSV